MAQVPAGDVASAVLVWLCLECIAAAAAAAASCRTAGVMGGSTFLVMSQADFTVACP